MKAPAVVEIIGTLLLCGAACNAQSRPIQITDKFQNLDFAAGAVGEMPPGWRLGHSGNSGYAAFIAGGAACRSGGQCGNVESIGPGPHGVSFLYQDVDATPYRGKRLTYRAAVRADVTGGNAARLLVRIHRENDSTSFRDDMGNHPITSGSWTFYEIDAPIVADARDIEFGMQLVGEGSASIDNISTVFVDDRAKSDEEAVRALVQGFADLRNAHDGQAVAGLYSEDGEWLNAAGEGAVRGRQELATLWGRMQGHVGRTVQSVDFPGANIAVVHVAVQYAAPIGLLHEVFIAVKENGTWSIRIHQTLP